jgi:hypothetical protein
VDHIVPHDVPINNPVVTDPLPSPAPVAEASMPRSKPMTEADFYNSPQWKDAALRGRILRKQDNGFVVQKDDNTEGQWWPAKVGPDGKVVRDAQGNPLRDPALTYDVTGRIGQLSACYPRPDEPGSYTCDSLGDDGWETAIPVVPINSAAAQTPAPPVGGRVSCDGKACFPVQPANSPLPPRTADASQPKEGWLPASEAEFKKEWSRATTDQRGHVIYTSGTHHYLILVTEEGKDIEVAYDLRGGAYDTRNLNSGAGYCKGQFCYALDKNGRVVGLLKK